MTTTYTQLTLMKESEMTPEQALFMQVHTEMVHAGQKAAESLLVLASDLKKMRDEKLYLAAGFVDFRDYVQNALNIKERHAYNYIKLLDLAPDYLKANAGLGVTKLALIAGASDEVREKLMLEEETTELSVRELTVKIQELDAKLQDKEQQISMLTEQLEGYQSEEELEEAAPETTSSESDKKYIEELEFRVAHAEGYAEAAKQKMNESRDKVEKLIKQLEELKNKPAPQPVIQTITNTETIEVDNPETLHKLEEAEKELAQTKKQLEVSKPLLSRFKVKFEDLQRVFGEAKEIISTMEKADAEKCTRALKEVIKGWEL